MIYVESNSVDPAWNLAMEEYLADQIPAGESCLFLWQNDRTIAVGKNQNTSLEINLDYVRQKGIRVCRRLSGGGTVYHDLGNLNYTFIADAPESGGISFAAFCEPVVQTIRSFGADAQLSGRNDILVEGKKISGNAQYYRNGRVIHHGTILFDSDLTVLTHALMVDKSKFQGKGIESVSSRVTNLKDHLPSNVDLPTFRQRLMEQVQAEQVLSLTEEDREAISGLKQRYDSWEWNYGYSPAYSGSEQRRIEGCGTVQVRYEMERGVLKQIRIQGDFFGEREIGELEQLLQDCPGSRTSILNRLEDITLSKYIFGMEKEELAAMIAPEGETI